MKSYFLTVLTSIILLFSNNSVSAQCSKKCTTDTCKTEQKFCCSTKKDSLDAKTIEIELLYLDLSVCGRCKSTDKVVEESINDVKTSLSEMGSTFRGKFLIGLKKRLVKQNIISSYNPQLQSSWNKDWVVFAPHHLPDLIM